jgi:hypothetical protein
MSTRLVVPRASGARPGVAPRSSRFVLGALVLVALLLMARVVLPLASALLFAAVLAGALHPWLVWLAGRLGGKRRMEIHGGLIFFALVGGLGAFGTGPDPLPDEIPA